MPLAKHPKTLLTIVTEAVLERTVVREARERGAQHWLVTEVLSAGSKDGVREGGWTAERTVKIQLICEPAVADAIAEALLAGYSEHYSLAIWFDGVSVLRPERY